MAKQSSSDKWSYVILLVMSKERNTFIFSFSFMAQLSSTSRQCHESVPDGPHLCTFVFPSLRALLVSPVLLTHRLHTHTNTLFTQWGRLLARVCICLTSHRPILQSLCAVWILFSVPADTGVESSHSMIKKFFHSYCTMASVSSMKFYNSPFAFRPSARV